MEEANGRHLLPDKTPEFWVAPEWKGARSSVHRAQTEGIGREYLHKEKS